MLDWDTLSLLHKERLRNLRALVTDVDGILTDGRLWLDPGTGQWVRSFHIHDGMGLKMLVQNGLRLGWITGSQTQDIKLRAEKLGAHELHMGIEDKAPVFHSICQKWGLSPEEVAYVGDDLPDLPVLLQAGIGFTVPNAHDQILQNQEFLVTKRQGGWGAMREITDLILKAKGVSHSVSI